MEVILLEKIYRLGSIGDVVKVKDGFGRNFLIPRKKAMRATESAKAAFEQTKADLETQNLELKSTAEKVASKIANGYFTVLRQAGEDGKLFGSVSAKDIADAINHEAINKTHIILTGPVKFIGVYSIAVNLHSDVPLNIFLNVSRSESEASEAIVIHKRSAGGKEEAPEESQE